MGTSSTDKQYSIRPSDAGSQPYLLDSLSNKNPHHLDPNQEGTKHQPRTTTSPISSYLNAES